MNVGQLIRAIQDYDPNTKVVIQISAAGTIIEDLYIGDYYPDGEESEDENDEMYIMISF